ncbi:MAG: hypothetical protein ACRD44_12580 [Bryobacteraceae bacterium]
MTVTTEADLKRNDGKECVVAGLYQETDIRLRPKGAPQLIGYVAIILSDGTSIMLEPSWSEAAIRPEAERKAFAGRRVLVTGTVHMSAPKPAASVNYLVGPCISPVESVRLKEP